MRNAAAHATISLMSPALGIATLIAITVIWGTTFAIVKEALDVLPVPLLLALRFTLAALALAWVRLDRRAWRPAVILGLLAFAGFATQTIGLNLTTASKAAFITGLNVILTPIVGSLWFKSRIPAKAYLAALIALTGLGLLTLTSFDGINSGDLWVLATALFYAYYIVYLGEVAGRVSALSLSAVQLWPMAALAWLWALPHLDLIPQVPLATWGVLVYLAVVATAIVTVAQTYAQRVVPAYVAAVIFVLEPVFAAVFAYWLLGEVLGLLGWVGGGLVVLAMLISGVRFQEVSRAERRAAGDKVPVTAQDTVSPRAEGD